MTTNAGILRRLHMGTAMILKGIVAPVAICVAESVARADAIWPKVFARAQGYPNPAWNGPHISVL